MRRTFLPATLIVLVAITPALIKGQKDKEIVGVMPAQVRWFTPPYYTDGRQRAQLYGDSNQGGPWIDRVKIPAGKHVAAHTHPQDEMVTVIDGTWYVGVGDKYDPAKVEGLPRRQFCSDSGWPPAFRRGEGKCRQRPAKRRRKISHRICREINGNARTPPG